MADNINTINRTSQQKIVEDPMEGMERWAKDMREQS